jgi:chaperonin cofactor prefoldin
MGLTRRRSKVTAREPEWVQDSVEAELAERVEVIDAQLAILDAERSRLETGLAEGVEVLEARLAILDAERTVLETELAERVEAIEAQIAILDAQRTGLETELGAAQSRAPSTVLVHEEDAAPIARGKAVDWWRLVLLVGFVLAPWAVIGALVYVVWLLLAW